MTLPLAIITVPQPTLPVLSSSTPSVVLYSQLDFFNLLLWVSHQAVLHNERNRVEIPFWRRSAEHVINYTQLTSWGISFPLSLSFFPFITVSC